METSTAMYSNVVIDLGWLCASQQAYRMPALMVASDR